MKMASIVAALALLTGGIAPTATFAVSLHTVALSGTDDARGPGLGSGAFLGVQFFTGPRLVPGVPGAVVFQTGLSGSVSGTGEFHHDGTSNTAVLRTGQQVPGLAAGVNVASFDDSPLGASNGTLISYLFLSGAGVTSSNDRAMLIVGSGGTSVTREGESVPGLPATTLFSRFEDFGNRHYGNRGALFGATLQGPGVTSSTNQTLVVGLPGSLEVLAREGSQIPNLPVGATYTGGMFGAFSGSDGVLIMGRATNGTVPVGTQNAVNLYQGGVYTLLARQNVSTLTNRPGVFAGELFNLHPSSSGKFVTYGDVDNGGTLRPSLVLGDHTGGLEVLVDSDSVLPGGSSLTGIRNYSLSPDGRFVAFSAETSDGKTNLFRYDTVADAIARVASEGDARPEGGAFGFIRDTAFAVNSSGLLAFTEGNTATKIYSFSDAVGLSLLVPESFDVDDGPGLDVRSVDRLAFTSAGEGSPPLRLSPDGGLVLGDDGTLVFQASFTDGTTGIFTTNVVPEPQAIVVALIAGLPWLGRRRRGR